MSARPLVEVEDLGVEFVTGRDRSRAVGGVSFTIEPGRCHALVGESGSGKSVTARALVGLNGDTAVTSAGVLRVDGRDLTRYRGADWRSLRGSGIGLVLQDALQSLDPLQTIGHEIAEALGERFPARYRRDAALRARVLELLSEVGVPEPETRIDQYSHELSGGLRQRALIATAIARRPGLIIADEPTTALDTSVQREILALLTDRLSTGTALLLISHDLSLVAEIADTVSVLESGVVVESGVTAEVLRMPSHPYTRRLLAAVPTEDARGHRLAPPDDADAAALSRTPLPPRAGSGGPRVLRAENLRKTYPIGRDRSRHALDDVSLELAEGETLGVVGESGSGKTTLVRVLLGLAAPDSGTVTLDGEPWSPLPERVRRPRRSVLQLVSQDPLGSFDPRYSVGRIIADGARAGGATPAAARTRTLDLLEAVGLDRSVVDRDPRTISGGQRQRVAIARALAAGPRVLVCDEPVSALDVSVQATVLDLIADLQHDFGTAVLFVSHDLGVIHHVSDRVLVMRSGQVVETGEVTSVYRDPSHPYTRSLLAAVPRLAAASGGS